MTICHAFLYGAPIGHCEVKSLDGRKTNDVSAFAFP